MTAIAEKVLSAKNSAHDPPRTFVVMGIDGAGKSTAIATLVQELNNEQIPARSLANAAGRRWLNNFSLNSGIRIPRVLQELIETTLRIFNVVRNSLAAAHAPGLTVMDRHLYCQLVLRHVRSHKPGLLLPWLARKFTENTTVILLDVDPLLAFERINARAEDEEPLEYLQTARAEYLRLAKLHGWLVLDASVPTTQLVDQLRMIAGK
ncbi:thymidylate kinase [Glutamicibacter mishrai]|uniref:thymidylate kinase n=1 Tax=Glutamicibacter mishrai TaxID=1775880 RepID=UPI003F79357B